MTIPLGPSLLGSHTLRFRLHLSISLTYSVGERSTYSCDLPISSISRYRPSLQLSDMRNNNDREDDDEEYTGDSTPYYQACFVSTGSPVLSTFNGKREVVDVHDLLGWFGGYYHAEEGGGIVKGP